MPTNPTYPGVYIEELPSGVRTVSGVATSITGFVGRALRGALNAATSIHSFADFEREFGGLWTQSTLSYAIYQYFQNGGGDAVVVRVAFNAKGATTTAAMVVAVKDADGHSVNYGLTLQAASEGVWGNRLAASISTSVDKSRSDAHFNLEVVESGPTGRPVMTENFLNLSMNSDSSRYVVSVLAQESTIVRAAVATVSDASASPTKTAKFSGGTDGDAINDSNISDGLEAFEGVDLFNLLVVPPPAREGDVGASVLAEALALCTRKRALLLVDGRSTWTSSGAPIDHDAVDNLYLQSENAAIFFPRLKMPDPLREGRLDTFPPAGAVAGVMARTDASRGLWKAPAGVDANILGASGVSVPLTDAQIGDLNPRGINCLRTFPGAGTVVWGSRTLKGADILSSEWKYIPVRRLALYLEESLYRGTQWAVFEPNADPLWAQIRSSIGGFMQGLFLQGAFKGKTPSEAYLVRCDATTTTTTDINRGIVNIVVGFAPLKPAEFVILKFQQLAGQTGA